MQKCYLLSYPIIVFYFWGHCWLALYLCSSYFVATKHGFQTKRNCLTRIYVHQKSKLSIVTYPVCNICMLYSFWQMPNILLKCRSSTLQAISEQHIIIPCDILFYQKWHLGENVRACVNNIICHNIFWFSFSMETWPWFKAIACAMGKDSDWGSWHSELEIWEAYSAYGIILWH